MLPLCRLRKAFDQGLSLKEQTVGSLLKLGTRDFNLTKDDIYCTLKDK